MTLATDPHRNRGLDTLRALAIVLVLLHHYVLFVSGESTFGAIGDVGWIGVDLFFALSGYLIGNGIFGTLGTEGRLALGRFYMRRILRTVPVFYVVLALFACWPWFRAGQELPPLWRFLTFTMNLGLTPGSAFSHAWSLCIEEQFYLVLPAVVLLLAPARRSPAWMWGALALVVAIGLAARTHAWYAVVDGQSTNTGYFQSIYYASLCRLDELAVGVALALLKHHHARLWSRITGHGQIAFLAALAILVPTCHQFLADRYGLGITVFGYPLLALGFGLLLVAALSPGSLLQRTRVPGAQAIALWSYAIYLIHKQIGILGGDMLRQHGIDTGSAPGIALIMLVSVLAGWMLYRCVELPFMALRERYFGNSVGLLAVNDHRLERGGA